MIRSINGLSAHRHVSRSLLLAAFALGLATTLAIAQQSQVPKTAPKAATKAAPVPGAVGAPATAPAWAQGSNGEWVKVCKSGEDTGNKQVCLVSHEGLDPNSGLVVVTAAVRTVEGEDKQHLLVTVTTAYTLVIPVGVQIKIDENEPIQLQYGVCLPPSCQAQMELTKEMLEKMRTGKQLIVAAMNMQQKTMGFGVPLAGFSAACDGPPTDYDKYQEARRQMLEQSRQHQIELAKKAGEAQLKNQQEGGQPQGNAPVTAPANPQAPPPE